MKKMFVFMLSLMLFIGSSFHGRAESKEPDYLKGTELNRETIQILEEAGVPLSSNTKIEIRTVIDGSKSGNVILVTNPTKEMIRKDVVALITDHGELAVNNLRQLAAASVSSTPINYNGIKVNLTATAYYYRYFNSADFSDHYFRPQKVTFSYTKKATCNVTRIEVKYITDGKQYSYPGFVDLNLPEYVHSIVCDVPYPSVSTTYTKTKVYRSDRVIYVSSSASGLGSNMYITFNVYINSSLSEYYTVYIL